MKVDNDATIAVATISIVMYGSLAIICFYHGYMFWQVVSGKIEGGLYSKAKLAFFVVLGISSTLELPTFMGCLVKGGPYGCVWDEDGTHDLVWCAHLIATCGFMYSVTSTATLWSDVIQLKDGNFFNSISPLDRTKIYFRWALGIYCAIVLSTMVAVMIRVWAGQNKEAHSHSKELGAIAYCLVPIMLVAITCGCFYCGTQLQQHVVRVKLDTPMLNKILFNLNVTMFVISASYIMRALLVLSLYAPMPNSYSSQFEPFYHYSVWIPITQWFPYWFCSLCLVEQMRFKPVEHRPDSITVKNLSGLQLNELARTISKDSMMSSSELETRSSTGTGRSAHTSTDEATRVARTLSYLLTQVDEHGNSGVRTSASDAWRGGRFAGLGGGGLETGSADDRDRESRDRTSTGSTSYFERLSGGGGGGGVAVKPDQFFTVSALHSRASGVFSSAVSGRNSAAAQPTLSQQQQ